MQVKKKMEGVVGTRFHPTDEELINYYLQGKIRGSHSDDIQKITDIGNRLSDLQPDDIPKWVNRITSNDKHWCFFCQRKKYKGKSSLIRRTAGNYGFWKSTGKDRNIRSTVTDKIIGKKKCLVFYRGKFPGSRTPWIIHEYQTFGTPENHHEAPEELVLCKLMKNEDARVHVKNKGEAETSSFAVLPCSGNLVDSAEPKSTGGELTRSNIDHPRFGIYEDASNKHPAIHGTILWDDLVDFAGLPDFSYPGEDSIEHYFAEKHSDRPNLVAEGPTTPCPPRKTADIQQSVGHQSLQANLKEAIKVPDGKEPSRSPYPEVPHIFSFQPAPMAFQPAPMAPIYVDKEAYSRRAPSKEKFVKEASSSSSSRDKAAYAEPKEAIRSLVLQMKIFDEDRKPPRRLKGGMQKKGECKTIGDEDRKPPCGTKGSMQKKGKGKTAVRRNQQDRTSDMSDTGPPYMTELLGRLAKLSVENELE